MEFLKDNPFTMTNYSEPKKNLRASHIYTKKEIDKALSREAQIEELVQNIFDMIPSYFLKKEYYPNADDWSNEEISNIVAHSPSDIEKRKKEWKWVFYMNSCISQTLYTINKLKEIFPSPTRYINLWIEFLQFVDSGDVSAHAFIEIKIPSFSPIIIDYAHNNDVYIYKWEYKNSTPSIKSLNIVSIPSDHFNENDDIIQIAEKSPDKIPTQEINRIKKMLKTRTAKLCKDNTGIEKFKSREQEQGNSTVYCFENGRDENENPVWLRIKPERTNPTKFSIENGKDENWNTVWAELEIEDVDPPRVFMKNGDWYIDLTNRFKNKFIIYLLIHCK